MFKGVPNAHRSDESLIVQMMAQWGDEDVSDFVKEPTNQQEVIELMQDALNECIPSSSLGAKCSKTVAALYQSFMAEAKTGHNQARANANSPSPIAADSTHAAGSTKRHVIHAPALVSTAALDHVQASVAAFAALKWAMDADKKSKQLLTSTGATSTFAQASGTCTKAILKLLHGLLTPHLLNLAIDMRVVYQMGLLHMVWVLCGMYGIVPEVHPLVVAMMDRFASDKTLQQLDYITTNSAGVKQQLIVAYDLVVLPGKRHSFFSMQVHQCCKHMTHCTLHLLCLYCFGASSARCAHQCAYLVMSASICHVRCVVVCLQQSILFVVLQVSPRTNQASLTWGTLLFTCF